VTDKTNTTPTPDVSRDMVAMLLEAVPPDLWLRKPPPKIVPDAARPLAKSLVSIMAMLAARGQK
jgi:hypothetical protein